MFQSCRKDVLDKQSLTTLTATQAYGDSVSATLALNYVYQANQPGWAGNDGSATSIIANYGPGSMTEENISQPLNPILAGSVTTETVGDLGSSNSATNNYGRIRTINLFISEMATANFDTGTKTRMIGQCLFWRAYRYFALVKIYGGVPLVLTPLPIVGDAAKLAGDYPRATTTETFNQIVSDLNTAIADLPIGWPNIGDYGRITKGAAQAFLGRVLLTWASPQFNTNNDMTRWQTAYDANTTAIATLSAHGYGLYPKEDVTMWTTEGGAAGGVPVNPEAVLVTEYNTSSDAVLGNNTTYTQGNVPAYLGGKGGNNPTWDEVQAFPMADGKAPGISTKYPYDPQHFFDNRDPRFYQTIAYNGCNWPLEGNSTYRLWTYFYYSNTAGTKNSSTEATSAQTGFYCRKAVDPSLAAANIANSGTDWQEIRYAEVLLNQAECAAEIGNTAIAYSDLIAIRQRAGIEAGTDGMYGLTAGMSGDALINAIMFERQIEFAYEGKRYWDLRRRKLLESTLNGKERQGVTIQLVADGSGTDYLLPTRDLAATASLDDVYSTYFTVTPKTIDTQPISYQTADYFFGIQSAAIQNDPKLLQNNTWGGTFDPTK